MPQDATEFREIRRQSLENPHSAALTGKARAYLVWGVDDETHEIVGTSFAPSRTKVGGEELENWLLRHLTPKIHFQFWEVEVADKPVVLLEIGGAFRHPVQFKGSEFIRVGSYKKRLREFPEKERTLWRIFDNTPFEAGVAAERLSADQVLNLLDYPAYFELMQRPLPEGRSGIISALQEDDLIQPEDSGSWCITNLGAILFARRLSEFRNLRRKTVRVIQYEGTSRVRTIKEYEVTKGYANGFEGLIEYINGLS